MEIPLALEGPEGAPVNSAFLVRLADGSDVKVVLNPAHHYDGYYTAAGDWTPPHLLGLCLKPPGLYPGTSQPSICLFNLTADPRETRNLALTHIGLATDLVERFAKTYMYQADYRDLQNMTQHPAGLPARHGGRWVPWL